jgi:RNA polymerase sigma-70 factor (ECF subfamily)
MGTAYPGDGSGTAAGCQDAHVTTDAEFEAQRRHLFGLAYRMLGSATDAEDVLQDAWLRWQGVDRARVTDPAAFLARTVTNLCLTALTSARARREVYVGPWLPEPVVTGAAAELGPLEDAVQRESVSFAVLALLERLTPAERAAFVLREAFGHSPREVAELIGTSEANARQLHARARRHVDTGRTRPVDPARWRSLVTRFLGAARDGDLPALETMLADDVVSRADGGGVVNAARQAVRGRERVARYVAGVMHRSSAGLCAGFAEVNGEPAILATDSAGLRAVWFLTTDGERVTGLDLVLNPDKLAFAGQQLSQLGALPGREG